MEESFIGEPGVQDSSSDLREVQPTRKRIYPDYVTALKQPSEKKKEPFHCSRHGDCHGR